MKRYKGGRMKADVKFGKKMIANEKRKKLTKVEIELVKLMNVNCQCYEAKAAYILLKRISPNTIDKIAVMCLNCELIWRTKK